jgi:hypothetical protein
MMAIHGARSLALPVIHQRYGDQGSWRLGLEPKGDRCDN